MPFKSEKQRRWMHANNPEMAKKWEKKEKKMKREQRVRELIKKMVREEMAKMDEAWDSDVKDFGKKSGVKVKPHSGTLGAYGAKPVKPEISKKVVPFFKKKGYKLIKQHKVSSGAYKGDLVFVLQGKDKKKYLVSVNTNKEGTNINFNLHEAAKRDYKAEYKKFQSSTKSKKYRAELNAYNRKKGTYGNGDGKDASHKGGKIAGFEAESKNRGRAEKSRLKKEGKLTEKSAISLNLWIKEFERLAKKNRMKPVDFIKKHISKRKGMDNEVVKDVLKHFQKNEGKLTEATDSYVVWSPLLNKVYDGPVSEKEALRLVKKYSKQGQYHVGMQGTKYYNKTKLGKKNPIKEGVEPTGGMAKIAAIVKNKQHGKVGGKTVDMQSANLLMKLYNAVKDKDKEKMNKMNEKKLIVVLHKLWSRVNLKLPV